MSGESEVRDKCFIYESSNAEFEEVKAYKRKLRHPHHDEEEEVVEVIEMVEYHADRNFASEYLTKVYS